MAEVKDRKLKAAIKRQLRLKNLTYKDLAEHLECSVPTVKRILGNEELTVTRLLDILSFLNLNLTELELLAAQGESKTPQFTVEQDEFLAKNPHFFSYLLELYKGESPRQIAEKFGLNQRSTDKYLITLERMDLIRVTGRQKVKPYYDEMPSLKNGLLAKTYYESILRTAGEFFIHQVGDTLYSSDPEAPKRNPGAFSVHSGRITKDTYMKYLAERKKLVADLLTESKYETKTLPESELKTVVMMDSMTLVENDYKPLKKLENLFGPVKPI